MVQRSYTIVENFAKCTSRQVTIENLYTGEILQDEADVVISARGTLNDKSWPAIPGLEDMKIPVMHSAAWDDRYVKGAIDFYISPLTLYPVLTSRTRG
jgi:cation diffusion facilitator CzcD-associated flavoprotein CzcO